jgi:MinD-like ATPase involved in chromosome partitioning or flagellar assembly
MQNGGTPAIRVLIADEISRIIGQLDGLTAHQDIEVCGIARTPPALFDEARRLEPDVVLMPEGFGGIDSLAAAEELLALTRPVAAVLLSDAIEGLVDRARQVGVHEVLASWAPADELAEAIRRASQSRPAGNGTAAGWGIVERDHAEPTWVVGGTVGDGPLEAPSEDGAGDVQLQPDADADVEITPLIEFSPGTEVATPEVEPAAPAEEPTEEPAAEALLPAEAEPEPMQPVVPRKILRSKTGRKPCETFVVFAGKGGVGKSVVASNLAVALRMETGGRVALIDLDLQFGDVGVMLKVEHPHTIEALAQHGDQVDIEILEEVMAHGPEDVRVLLAPTSPEFADLITTGTLRAIMRELTRNFDYIVVDTPPHLEERTLEALEQAAHIVIVTAFNVTAVKDTKITLRLLQSLGLPRDRVAVVLNQTKARTNFTREEVEDNLRFRIVTQLPFEARVVDESIDHGRPFYIHDPKADITRAFKELVEYLVPAEYRETEGKTDTKKTGRRRFSLGRG